MHIQRIHLGEIALVAALFNDYRVYYGQPDDIYKSGQYLKERLQNNESVIFTLMVAEGNADTLKPVGFTQLYAVYSSVQAVKNWVLNDLFVDETYRNKGYGKKLIEAAIEFARGVKSTYIQLETSENNIGAQKLYETIGFSRYNPHQDFLVYKIDV